MPLLLELLLALAAPSSVSAASENRPPASCPSFPDAFLWFAISPETARQGGTLSLTPMYRLRGPYGAHSIAAECLSDWSVSPSGAATLSKDRSKLLIGDDAKPGSDIALSARFGPFQMNGAFLVVGRDEAVLTGKYSQSAGTGCGNSRPVGELVFDSRGNYSVTHQPFETFVDYSGTYEWDSKTGALRLFSAKSPTTPLKEGIARFEGGRLVLEGIMLDLLQPPPVPGEHGVDGCRLVF
ncbi:MAG TPA: hypothetical protein VF582_08160 [Allosphingosinicella sp.]|jgi:hypothetical protein